MKDYKAVVTERFDLEKDISASIYAANHPIGKYSREVLFSGLHRFLVEYAQQNKNFSEIKLLDVGCGSGGMIEYFISKGFSPQNCFGIDLSSTRISSAQQMLPNVNFIYGDALNLNFPNVSFDLITSFDLYSHITKEHDIVKGLKNVNKSLATNGIFLWYDIYSKDHYSAPKNSESWGFNKQQMIQLATDAGFELIAFNSFFKNFFGRYHSVYQAQRIPAPLLKVLEKVIPGTPGNIMLILKKRT
jgi:ubiquinone/menaquinone biosynthesis C-methylase UbiE